MRLRDGQREMDHFEGVRASGAEYGNDMGE